MFTGIIEEIGKVERIQKDTCNCKLSIKASKILEDIHLGDSIAVNGICLTVTCFTRQSFTVDVMNETWNRTALSLLRHAFGSLRCDCGQQLDKAMKMIAENGSGVLLYMRQEGRGIGLVNKLKAYHLQDNGMDTLDANLALGFQGDLREYYIGAQILRDLGIKSLHLLTNNPDKVYQLEDYGMKISSRVPIEIEANPYDSFYLKTKKDRMGHILNMEEK